MSGLFNGAEKLRHGRPFAGLSEGEQGRISKENF